MNSLAQARRCHCSAFWRSSPPPSSARHRRRRLDGQPTGTPHLILTLKDGDVDIQLMPDIAPKHVERIIDAHRQGLLQRRRLPPRHRRLHGADRRSDRRPASGGSRPARRPGRVLEHATSIRGIVGAARSQDPNSFNSQFFIMLRRRRLPRRPVHGLRQGRVRHGVVDKIKKGDPQPARSTDPDKIISAKIVYK